MFFVPVLKRGDNFFRLPWGSKFFSLRVDLRLLRKEAKLEMAELLPLKWCSFIVGLLYIQFPTSLLFLSLTLKVPITTASDDIYKYFFIVFQRKYDLKFYVNPLPGRGFT